MAQHLIAGPIYRQFFSRVQGILCRKISQYTGTLFITLRRRWQMAGRHTHYRSVGPPVVCRGTVQERKYGIFGCYFYEIYGQNKLHGRGNVYDKKTSHTEGAETHSWWSLAWHPPPPTTTPWRFRKPRRVRHGRASKIPVRPKTGAS
jgi:hypothetical protein